MPKKGPSHSGPVADEKKLSSASKKKSSDEIDEIFASKKAGKCGKSRPGKHGDALSVNPKGIKDKKRKTKKKSEGRVGDDLQGTDTGRASQPRRRTGDGLAVYTEDELGINSSDAGKAWDGGWSLSRRILHGSGS